MSNPLFNGNRTVNTSNTNPTNDIKQRLASDLAYLKRFRSPQEFWDTLQRENPQLANYLISLSQTMQNPMGMAMQALNEKGINLQEVMSMIQ